MIRESLTSIVSTTLIWLGRAGALASIALLSQFVIGSIQSGDPAPTAIESIGIACFPVGVVVGMLIGWRWPMTGGSVSLLSLFAFYVWSYVAAGRLNNGPYFILFTLPAVFYLVGACMHPSEPRRTSLGIEVKS